MHGLIARLSLVAAVSALTAVATVAAAPQWGKKLLEPGESAPKISTPNTKWVQGEEPDLNEGVIVVEFWATWCKPCQRAIPHLNRMHKALARYGLKVVGVAADEADEDSDDRIDRVKNFVKSKGDGMSYTVVVDPMGELKREWMEAAKQKGIPCTFVVGRSGKVLWIGNPHDDLFVDVVKLAVRGKYDPKLTPKGFEARAAAKRAADLRNWREAYQHMDTAIEIDAPLFGWLIVDRYKMVLEQEKNPEAAKAYLQKILPAVANDPYSLDLLVTAICKDPEISSRDLDGAMVVAQQLQRAAGPQSTAALTGTALVHATKGEIDKAVEIQTTAWLAAAPDEKPEMKRLLDEYQKIKARKEQAKALVDD